LTGTGLPPYFNFIAQLIEHKKILIALVNGPSIGIGVTLLAHFDLVIASDKAYFMTPFTQLGLSVEASSSWTFFNHLGRIPASRLLLFSEKIDANEAKQLGLVSHVVPHANFEQTGKQFLERLKTLAPQVIFECYFF
jgi:peroxisomal 3,2-trans-enoyl-CoA isomerase